jgi:hypothetical protein
MVSQVVGCNTPGRLLSPHESLNIDLSMHSFGKSVRFIIVILENVTKPAKYFAYFFMAVQETFIAYCK